VFAGFLQAAGDGDGRSAALASADDQLGLMDHPRLEQSKHLTS
jgi:hypothetical protein